MIYEHYYKYLNAKDPSAIFLEYIAPEKKEALENDHKMAISFKAEK
jgi:hypothetical protein